MKVQLNKQYEHNGQSSFVIDSVLSTKDSSVNVTQSCSRQDANMRDQQPVNFTEIMMQRWIRSNALLPDVDKQDMVEDSPLFNREKSEP